MEPKRYLRDLALLICIFAPGILLARVPLSIESINRAYSEERREGSILSIVSNRAPNTELTFRLKAANRNAFQSKPLLMGKVDLQVETDRRSRSMTFGRATIFFWLGRF